jgi:hypothetical protein
MTAYLILFALAGLVAVAVWEGLQSARSVGLLRFVRNDNPNPET